MSRIPIIIVNNAGDVVGTAPTPRSPLQKGEYRLIARVMLQNSNGQFLLQKRAARMEVYPNCWDQSAAGHVDDGETVEMAAYRELKEELGLGGVKLEFIITFLNEDTLTVDGKSSPTFNYLYKGKFDGVVDDITIQESEVSEIKWYNRVEINELLKNKNETTAALQKIFGDELV